MIEKITDQNLERYDSRLKEWCDRKFFEKGNYGKYETTEEAGAVAFYPAPDTSLEGKIKFSFKETMPASGDKGSNNPSTITGVNSVYCSIIDNKLDGNIVYSSSYSTDIVEATIANDGLVTVNVKAPYDSTIYATFRFLSNQPIDTLKSYKLVTYIKEFTDSSIYHSLQVGLTGNAVGGKLCGDGSSTTYKGSDVGDMNLIIDLVENDTPAGNFIVGARLAASSGYVGKLVFRLCLIEDSATLLQREITSFPLGSTYYGGCVDLSTGLMTVTHSSEQLTSVRSVQSVNTDTVSFRLNTTATFIPENPGVQLTTASNRFIYYGGENLEYFRVIGSYYGSSKLVEIAIIKARLDVSSATDPSEPTDAEWKAALALWLESNPTVFVGKLFTPYTVQLTPQQILSLSQPDKYTPRLNTVYTDADSIQISYLKSPIRDEYEKTQAILSLGGNS